MHAIDEHLLIIRAIEDADPASFRKPARGAPEEVMLELFGARLLETDNLTASRINSGHDVPDGAVLPGGIHSLEDQEQCVPIGRIMKLLQRAQLTHVLFQEPSILFLRFAKGLHNRRPLFEVDLLPWRYAEIL